MVLKVLILMVLLVLILYQLITADSALPKILELSKLPILALITGAEGAKRVTRVL